MQRLKYWIPRVIGAGLLVGAAGCQGDGASDKDGTGNPDNPGDIGDLAGAASQLLQATDCPDLLTKIQDDAVMKAKLAAFRTKLVIASGKDLNGSSGGDFGSNSSGDVIVDDGASEPPPNAGGEAGGTNGSSTGGTATGGGGDPSEGPVTGGTGGDRGPTSASGTNTQVAGVDEADFVKLVKGGERMFLLHGSKLLALKSWPAAETALDGEALKIEGSPSEMFVTENGTRAVIFSSVYDYSNGIRGGAYPSDAYCGPDYCGGYGSSFTKVTVADLSGTVPKAVRELYYEGSYLSSRRYPGEKQDVVRAIFQGYSRYSGLFNPEVDTRDAWGRDYEAEVIENQLNEWVERTTSAIRATKLEDWLPLVREAKNGELTTVAPTCDAYYVPKAGLTDYGLTHVLSMDINDAAADLGGITIMGAAQTVYSNAEHLVLAQPDYRWNQWDFGLVDEQQSALHMFAINGAETSYEASGWVPGFVPANNSQFAIDEEDGAIRIATTGWVRENPKAEPNDSDFWNQVPSNHVFTTASKDGVLTIAGKTEHLGHPGESIFAARFVGDRGYVVTAVENRDPLYVIDLKDPAKPTVLGEVEIPGFSEYVHPIDADHLVTVGQNGSGWGIQLQMFDVSNPMQIPQPKVLDFGEGSSSEASFNHKAFTYFAEQNLLAVPVYTYGYETRNGQYGSALKVIKVDTKTGFTLLGSVDHTALYGQQNCGYCDQSGCYNYSCGYAPEVRRGHFVADDADTFVYSVSYGGVLINNLDDLTTPIASVELPAPEWSEGSWYGGGGDVGGSNSGTSGGDFGTGGGTGFDPEPPTMSSDAGPATPSADAGVAMQ